MSPAGVPLLLFFLTLSLHTILCTAVPKKVSNFFPGDISPPTEMYWYSRLPNTPPPKALRDLLQPGRYPSVTREIANDDKYVGVDQRRYTILYKSIQQKNALPNSTLFYLYNDLHPGKKMKLQFTNSGTKVTFLPRQVAESIPFSSDQLSEILEYFSLQVNSKEAQVIIDEVGSCESPNMEGEEKYCATSLESLIDFNVERLGQNVEVLSTDPGEKQEYTVSEKAKMTGDHKATACHKMRYPYAVYYCHVIEDTEIYMVPLVGADGTKVEAVTVCHLNTSAWSPEHMAFQVLKIKPGPAFCHFLASDTLIWVPTKDQDMMTP
ncbi:hypothetical protein OIU79_022337 [Salix purpurea]|uniref:BURP domain-containing protein n=1 Tax=Salix purpurea TaxID=77065 RepID=A0A9Q1ACU0_SALPP|nr:hypothetical protein OIU79_022337 [Salix purpurea]